METDKTRGYEPPAGLLDGRIVLITGAGDGIGATLAKTCAAFGATAILTGRSQNKLESVYDEIIAAGCPRPGIFVMDFEQAGPEQYGQLFDATQDAYGRLVAGSLVLTFFVYVFVNIGMVSGLLPVVGVPLPLVSYGGTSIVTLMAGFGLLMSIHTHRRLLSD